MKPSTPATIDTSTLRTSLSPLLPIFDAFNHRHKNQHRSSHWWSHFSLLRRSIKGLFSCSSRQDVLLPRVRWLKDRIVPEAYVPFTQLAADNQHAPLGLLLVGLLASASTVVQEVLPDTELPASTPILETKSTSSVTPKTDKGTVISRDDFTRPKSTVAYTGPKPDKATAEPDDLEPLIPGKRKKETGEDLAPAALPKKKKKKSKAKGGDDFSSMFGSL